MAKNYVPALDADAKFFERVKLGDFDKVISDCGTCRMQINYGTDVKPVHPIEILAQAYA